MGSVTAKYQKAVRASMKQLSNALTRNDIEKIQIPLAIPTQIFETESQYRSGEKIINTAEEMGGI